ncbi:MAG: hypothetical protein MUE44_34765 [Oscillatoriaceae cyanobacterium Prado104]|nr:hypothetical protein [Oscillatoriaceae cyanobacterium Prado104]
MKLTYSTQLSTRIPYAKVKVEKSLTVILKYVAERIVETGAGGRLTEFMPAIELMNPIYINNFSSMYHVWETDIVAMGFLTIDAPKLFFLFTNTRIVSEVDPRIIIDLHYEN